MAVIISTNLLTDTETGSHPLYPRCFVLRECLPHSTSLGLLFMVCQITCLTKLASRLIEFLSDRSVMDCYLLSDCYPFTRFTRNVGP